jgi:hypothetical protein
MVTKFTMLICLPQPTDFKAKKTKNSGSSIQSLCETTVWLQHVLPWITSCHRHTSHWSFYGDWMQWSLLRQSAMPLCIGFLSQEADDNNDNLQLRRLTWHLYTTSLSLAKLCTSMLRNTIHIFLYLAYHMTQPFLSSLTSKNRESFRLLQQCSWGLCSSGM